jgi:DNA invertase Pin-like site-specific DNA recombinase
MERGIGIVVSGLFLAAGVALAAQDKQAGGGGPFGLPALALVKEKCKANEEQAKKLEEIYAAGTTNEADTKKRAKDSQTERKELEKFLGEGRTDVVNKVLELFDEEQDKTFNQLVKEAAPTKKKKK